MLRSLWSALRRKDDLSEELKSHLQMAIADRIARGESPAEARWAATREFGNVPLIADVTRERWGWLQLEHLLQDLRSALRHMRRSPGFSITAVLTLALGIGALTTVATWSNAVLYNPWPHVESPRDLRFVDATVLGNNGYSVHYDNYRFVRESGIPGRTPSPSPKHRSISPNRVRSRQPSPPVLSPRTTFNFSGSGRRAGVSLYEWK